MFTAISRKSSNVKTRPHQVELPVELSRNECALRSGNCALSAVNHSTRVQDRRRAAPWRHQQFPADRACDCDRASCCESCAMHRLHRFADDFFDSHFFALRFAVGSQCPKFDSQTAMRYRVNYSLYLRSPCTRTSICVWERFGEMVFVCVCVCVSVCVCVYACMHVRGCVWMWVCVGGCFSQKRNSSFANNLSLQPASQISVHHLQHVRR